MMQLLIGNRPKNDPVHIFLEIDRDTGVVSLMADDYAEEDMEKTLLEIHPTGEIVRIGGEEIGEFNFDKDGRVIISDSPPK
jgi:hypothetical protein